MTDAPEILPWSEQEREDVRNASLRETIAELATGAKIASDQRLPRHPRHRPRAWRLPPIALRRGGAWSAGPSAILLNVDAISVQTLCDVEELAAAVIVRQGLFNLFEHGGLRQQTRQFTRYDRATTLFGNVRFHLISPSKSQAYPHDKKISTRRGFGSQVYNSH